MEKTQILFVCCLALIAVVAGSLQKRDTEYALNDDEVYYNNYYNSQGPPVRRRNKSPFGWLQSIVRRASSGYDYDSGYSSSSYGYQPTKGGGGKFSFLGPALLVGLCILAALAVASLFAYLFTQLSGSGRGLDTDEWEVNHSVWMDQLQKDFEDSWAQE